MQVGAVGLVEDERRRSFSLFNASGGKFRVAVTNVCNLDCFFCHNEAMDNPRRSLVQRPPPDALDRRALLAIIDTYCALGGAQVNITGGEPLARPDIVELLRSIDKRDTRICLNSNALLWRRLTRVPRIPQVDAILASLHTTDDAVFREQLGGPSVDRVKEGILALSAHGYRVQINYSLGSFNAGAFGAVLDFALAHRIELKAIALVRPTEAEGFYGGEWVDPRVIAEALSVRGARAVGEKQALGGLTTTYDVDGLRVKVKNIARGRLRTDHCRGCLHRAACGEGIYGLRVGVDGVWKPCLLRRDRFAPVEGDRPLEEQILDHIHRMVGDDTRWEYEGGAPA